MRPEWPTRGLLLLRFLKSLPVEIQLVYDDESGSLMLEEYTVIMMTLECITRSERLLAPPKYVFRRYIRASHGSVFKTVEAYGMLEKPSSRISATRGIGIA